MTDFIFGNSKAMREIQQSIRKVASTDLPIFIQGETGTGKNSCG